MSFNLAEQAVSSAGFTATVSGLTVTFAPGTYRDAVGNVYSYAGGSITLVNPSTMSLGSTYTNHVYLIGGVLRGCSRAIHRGGLYLGAFVSTSSGTITSISQPTSFELKPSRVGRWLAQQANGVPTKVWGMGDSITVGAQASGSPYPSWMNLLFSASLSGSGYNVTNVANVTQSNYGNSGSASIWLAALTAKVVAQSKNANSVGAFNQVGHHRTECMQAQDTGTLKVIGTAKHFRNPPDLAIIGCGNAPSWSADYAAVQLETAIRRMRWAGSDVVLHTEQPFYSSSSAGASITNWTLLQDAARMERIADATGSDLVDTFGFMQWQRDLGNIATYYYSDNVHPNNAGHALWASVMGSVVNPQEKLAVQSYMPGARVERYAGTVNNQVGSGIDFYADYTNGTGTTTTDSQNGAGNLNTVATGASTSANVHSLAVGQKILVTHGGCLSVSLISALGANTTCTCHFENNAGTQIGSSFTVTGGYGQAITPMWKQSDFVALGLGTEWSLDNTGSPNRFPAYPLMLWLKVDSFTGGATALPVIGFVFETPLRKSIPNEACNFYGTWATETHSNYHEDGYAQKYTDTANSGVIVPFDGDMLELWIPWGSQAGTAFTVTVNGESVLSSGSLATPSGGGFVRHLWLQEWNSPRNTATQNGYAQPPATNYANLKLITAGSAPVAGNRSLSLLEKFVVKFD